MTSSRENFIKILKKLDKNSVGPDGLWQLNYAHWNNSNFYKGFTFNYWYEGTMPDVLECLEEIRESMIAFLEEMSDDRFDEGGWLVVLSGEVIVKFQIAGGPGSGPPWG